eukprot:1509477-Rhodomonas_salina.1
MSKRCSIRFVAHGVYSCQCQTSHRPGVFNLYTKKVPSMANTRCASRNSYPGRETELVQVHAGRGLTKSTYWVART